MNSNTLLLTALGVMFCSGCTTEQRLERLGTRIEVNEQDEIIGVDFPDQITDAGLVHLEGLTSLQELYLYNTEITGVGLVHLAGLTSLQELCLNYTRVTDTGLVHLEGLTSLQRLNLKNTQITDAGVAKLREALPNCDIEHF